MCEHRFFQHSPTLECRYALHLGAEWRTTPSWLTAKRRDFVAWRGARRQDITTISRRLESPARNQNESRAWYQKKYQNTENGRDEGQ